jgi:hypothetical protein
MFPECLDLARKLQQVAGVEYCIVDLGTDHAGDECVFIKAVVSDEIASDLHRGDRSKWRAMVTRLEDIARSAVDAARVPFTAHAPFVYFYYRSLSERDELKEKEWEPTKGTAA